jgi:hypothetical protein
MKTDVRAGPHDPLAALRAGSATVTICFIPGEAGCLKVFWRSRFGGLFPQSGVVFLR